MDSVRLGDAERATAVDLLAEHYSLGRLTKDEFDERCDALWSARIRGDVAPLLADLPSSVPVRTRAQVSLRRPELSLRKSLRLPLALVLFFLVGLTMLTHLPFVLLGLLVWFWLVRPRMSRRGGGLRR